MNHAGEILPLTAMVRPHVAVVTNVAPVHLEHFASVEAIADAKAEIFSGLEPGGTAIVPRDNAHYERLAAAARRSPGRPILSFGDHAEADARLAAFAPAATHSMVAAEIAGRPVTFRLGAPGRHLAENALAVLLAAHAVGRRRRPAPPARSPSSRRRKGAAHAPRSRCRRQLHPDRRELQRQPRLHARGAGARRRHRAGAAGAASPCSATCSNSGRAPPRFTPSWRRTSPPPGSTRVFAAGPTDARARGRAARPSRGVWRDSAADLDAAGPRDVRPGDVVLVKGRTAAARARSSARSRSAAAAPAPA